MADSFSLPLRPLKEKTEKVDNLPLLIAQINAQRGSFRKVTEESLQAEIDAGGDLVQAEDVKTADEEDQDSAENLFKSRAEIMEFAMYVPFPIWRMLS